MALWEFIIPYEKSHVRSLCVTFYFTCFWLTPVTVQLGNERFTAGTICQSRAFPMRDGARSQSQTTVNLDVSKRLRALCPTLLDAICVSAFLQSTCDTLIILIGFLVSYKRTWKCLFLHLEKQRGLYWHHIVALHGEKHSFLVYTEQQEYYDL